MSNQAIRNVNILARLCETLYVEGNIVDNASVLPHLTFLEMYPFFIQQGMEMETI